MSGTSVDLIKSLANGGPYDGRAGQGSTAAIVANDFGVMKFTGGVAATETTHHADPLPDHWQGREIGLTCTGGVCHVAFSSNSTAEVDRSVSATAVGAPGKVGLPLPNSISVETRQRVPQGNPGDTMYFVRESDTVGTIVYARLLA